MTVKEYYRDAYLAELDSKVISCREVKGGFEVLLDKTVFFPESGGQPSDSGMLGDAVVTDVRIVGEDVVHITDRPLPLGPIHSVIDFEKRYGRMQNHTGEHIMSGIAHRLHGCENVGFHLTDTAMTLDFDKYLTPEQLSELEMLANRAVRRCVDVEAFFPSEDELGNIAYRSKSELEGAIRIVRIEDVDVCACCAPHVANTGEVGTIKILSSERWKGGVRLYAACGELATREIGARCDALSTAAAGLSVKPTEIGVGIDRLRAELSEAKLSASKLKKGYIDLLARSKEQTEGNILIFDELLDMPSACELASLLAKKCRIAAVVSGRTYAVASEKEDMRAFSKQLNAELEGRGGGRAGLASGSLNATKEKIEKFFEK